MRSGTTSLTKILDTSSNAKIFVEQESKLCIESRDYYEGRIKSPKDILKKLKSENIKKVIDKGYIYGDKNPNYLPFISILAGLWNPKFVFVLRNGKDVAKSAMNWHEIRKGNIFGRREDDKKSEIIKPEDDWWDYSRIRPLKGEQYYENWVNMKRFEKIAWHWAKCNELILEALKRLHRERVHIVKIDDTSEIDIKKLFKFLCLEGYKREKVKNMLNSKINTSEVNILKNSFPKWNDWDDNYMKSFNKYAGKMMEKLGYC